VILSIISISFFLTGGSAYVPNPTVYHISGGSLALGILFAMGIPTGYGAIAPISGEVKNAEKVVGRSAISVILTGGLLASFFVYAMSNLLFQKNLSVSQITSALPILSILSNHFSNYSGYIVFAVSIAAINDGVLAILSFGSAASRTIFRMGYDRTFPELFAKKFRGQPINANIAVSLAIILIPIALLYFLPVYATFIILGTIASIGGLFIHVIAGISLMRVGVRRGRRLILRSSKSLFKFLLNYKEALLGGIAALITSIELVYSAYSSLIVYSTFFLPGSLQAT
jgi:amino acid transporter